MMLSYFEKLAAETEARLQTVWVCVSSPERNAWPGAACSRRLICCTPWT
jgi:hypothetical protein